MFNSISKYADQVDFAMMYIMVISVIMLLGVTAVMLYFVYKYSHKRNKKPIQTHGSAALETVWIVVPTIIVISMFYVGYADFDTNRDLLDDPDYVIGVMAKQFDWDFNYENGASLDTLYVPVNKTTRFDISSYDVLHSFYIPSFRIKEDAVPGRTTQYAISPLEIGVYDITCAEYCGVRHWNMYTKIKVLSQDEYDKWYAGLTKSLSEDTSEPVKEEVVEETETTEEEKVEAEENKEEVTH